MRCTPGSTSSPTPTSPTSTPASCGTRGRFPCHASHSTSHSGTVATSTDASPELTRRLAHDTAPLPTNNSSAPTMAALRHSTRPGAGAPRARAHATSTLPASRKRTAPSVKGGMVSTPQRMARYVEPHTT